MPQIVSKNDKDRIKNKLKDQLYLPYLISDTNIYANLDSKVDIIRRLKLDQFYDDSVDNLNGFMKLKKQFPEVEFHAHHVQHDPETGNVTVTSTSSEKPKEAKNPKGKK